LNDVWVKAKLEKFLATERPGEEPSIVFESLQLYDVGASQRRRDENQILASASLYDASAGHVEGVLPGWDGH
jgi:hypothetical protein